MLYISFQILSQLEGIVLNVIGVILQKNIMGKKLLQICFQKTESFFRWKFIGRNVQICFYSMHDFNFMHISF